MQIPKKVYLDPGGAYPVPASCIEIQTELDWIRYVGTSDKECWIKGQHLCQWTKEWLKAWNVSRDTIEEKEFPRVRLQSLLKQVPVPQEWTQETILEWVNRLESYHSPNPIQSLLCDIAPAGGSLWIESPSVENLALWLQVELPDEVRAFENCWRGEMASSCEGELSECYMSGSREELLRRWLLMLDPPLKTLGVFPGDIPKFLEDEFRRLWATKITETAGSGLDKVNPQFQPGMKLIAAEAYETFRRRPRWLSDARLRKIAPFLIHSFASELSSLIPPGIPVPLALEATPSDAMSWVTRCYLPYRYWEASQLLADDEEPLTEVLADSFVRWLLRVYPELKLEPVETSILNYSTAAHVLNLLSTGPVLWVVVDGMGWLEQCQLLDLLSAETDLRIAEELVPKISVLPTKTEYAKWALFAQLLPSHDSWVKEVAKGFAKIGTGQRYTDSAIRREALMRDLRLGSEMLYCWDTTEFDSLYHDEVDWSQLVAVGIPQTLRKIAHQIKYFVKAHPRPNELQVVLSSDHGQMVGALKSLKDCPPGFQYSGRLCEGRVSDPRFITLDADRFGLPHDISVVSGSGCIRSFQTSQTGLFVGTHGGLFPEEVVVGTSVLRISPRRRPIIVKCTGIGKPLQVGQLSVQIINHNEVSLTGLYLYVEEIMSLRDGQLLDIQVPAASEVTWHGSVPHWPELPVTQESNELALSGRITFRFAHSEEASVPLSDDSRVQVDQVFRSGMDINEFLS